MQIVFQSIFCNMLSFCFPLCTRKQVEYKIFSCLRFLTVFTFSRPRRNDYEKDVDIKQAQKYFFFHLLALNDAIFRSFYFMSFNDLIFSYKNCLRLKFKHFSTIFCITFIKFTKKFFFARTSHAIATLIYIF